MHTFTIGGKTVTMLSSGVSEAPVLYLNTFSGEGEKIFQAARAAGCPPFTLVAVSDLDWNRDMAPWDSPPAFRNGGSFTGGADGYLGLMAQEIIPRAEQKMAGKPRWRGIAGYSLAGLFALYAVCQTDLFSRAGSMSGSLWFPGLKEYGFTRAPKRRPDSISASRGDKESKTRNPLLRRVRQDTEEIRAFYQTRGIDTVFRLNPGNHYDHAAERTAAGILWMLNR